MHPQELPSVVAEPEAALPANFHHYLPIPEEVFHCGLFVTSVGAGRVNLGQKYPHPGHPSLYHFTWADGRTLPEFSLMIITHGRGVFESRASGQVSVSAGSALLIFPGIWHRYRPDITTGWSEKWMHFNGEFAHRLLAQSVISLASPVLLPKDPGLVETTFDRVLLTVRKNAAENSLRISLLGLALLSAVLGDDNKPCEYAAGSALPATGKTGSTIAQKAIQHIWTHGHKELTVEHVADAVGVNRRKLERNFQSSQGRGVLDEIIQCRYSRAERLVRETDLPLKSVVDLAGFGGMENMRRVFFARVGLSPSQYRKSVRRTLPGSGLPAER
ncbi:MAG: AraC family transcriptional regulator [Verrucomicrobia bacterium]|nr:AraC family transcriptional regulator [Verrucomicrobiota bacterium]